MVAQIPKEEAYMDRIDEYIELLYEDPMEDKVRVRTL
jgi:hypothetical protein